MTALHKIKHLTGQGSEQQTENNTTTVLYYTSVHRHVYASVNTTHLNHVTCPSSSGSEGVSMDTGNVLASLGVEGATAAAHALSLPAEAYGNDARLEVMWAMKAYNHAEVYYNLISSVDPKFLKLTKSDEQIYTKFREEFPDLSIQVLDPELLKSADAKEKWRPFCNQFEGVVEDFNYGTLLRLDCQKDYTEENTVFATRIQFYAIEIARNREGYNDFVHNANSKTKPQKKDKSES
uniref:Polysaccharide biosynthesis domain containing 1 n=2 Tax=Cyprinus carpio TaxID=7962 RepID=A0A8C1QQ94_CYPCA